MARMRILSVLALVAMVAGAPFACKNRSSRKTSLLSRNDEVRFSFNATSGDFEVRVSPSLAASSGNLQYVIGRVRPDKEVDCGETGEGTWQPGTSRGTIRLVPGQTVYSLAEVGNEIWLQPADPDAATAPFGKVSAAILESRGKVPREFTGETCVTVSTESRALAVTESLVQNGSESEVAMGWDGGSNNTAPSIASNRGLTGKMAGPKESDGSSEMREYVEACTAELGPVPGLDCFGQARVVPVTVTTANGVHALTDVDYSNGMQACDKPIMLQNQCAPYSRFASFTTRAVKGREPTRWAYFCRRYTGRPEGSRIFDDVNMIGHNPNTGATCFFNSKLNGTTGVEVSALDASPANPAPASTIPHPGAPDALKFWYPPYLKERKYNVETVENIRCARCHDNDAFLNSPFVAQAGTLPYGKYSDPDSPYYAVIFDKISNYDEWRPRHITSDTASACISCHRIGANSTCKYFADYAANPAKSAFSEVLSDFGKTHPWMPPGRSDDGSALPDSVTRALEVLHKCCDGNEDASCQFAPVPR